MTISENPCQVCRIDQRCCKDISLKVSVREYEKNFKKHASSLKTVKYNKMVIVFPKHSQPCPYWNGSGCSIYDDRPVDCRLYPFELHRLVEKKHNIEAVFYDQSDCPHKEALFIPVEEAKELITALARDVYGTGKPVEIKYEPGKRPPRAFGILNPLIARLSRLISSR